MRGRRRAGRVDPDGAAVAPALQGAWPRGARGRPPPGPPADVWPGGRERILAETLTPPEGATHWSTRRLAARVGVSASTVGRVWQEGRLKPHRIETFKYSRDPRARGQGHRRGRPLPRAARAGHRALGRREDPDPGARPDPADAAAASGAGRAPHPRLQAARHDEPVRGARGGHGQGDHRHPGAPHRRRLPGLPAARRADVPPGRGARRPRQRLHPQDPRRPGVAGAAPALHASTSRPPRRRG